jgi:hypothetical protein
VLWYDSAEKNSRGRTFFGYKPKASCSRMHLNSRGHRRADIARAKLGLKPLLVQD